jgi:amino acid adenylation domain-containing protein
MMSSSATILPPSVSIPAAASGPSPLFPCTLAQERFWVLDQLDPGNPALNIAVRWQLDGDVLAEPLERAWRAVIARHEILRSAIAERDGAPVQTIAPEVAFRMSEVDLRGLPEPDRLPEALRIAALEARAPFDLTAPPLLRATLVRLADRRSILHVTVHHLVADGWSIGVLAQEIGLTYRAFAIGARPDLPGLPVQYADYALWQAEWLATDALAPQTDYWVGHLHGLRQFELPTDRPRPPIQTASGAITSLLLPRSLTDSLQVLGGQTGTTLFTITLAALKTLLHRHTGETDVSLGTQVAGRDQAELEGLVGLFINTLVLRDELSGDPPFRRLLAQVGQTVQQALAHADMPIQRLIGQLRPERDLSRNALFSINFIFQRAFVRNADWGAVRLIDLPSVTPGAIYDLNFFMVERPDGWRASCEYNTDLFDEGTVTGLLEQFQHLLAGIAADPDRRLSDYDLLTDQARARLADGNFTVAAYPAETLPLLVAQQAAATPDALALVCGRTSLGFAELDQAANRLAHLLRREGVSPGVLVGIHLPRAPEMVVALLAVLKAGGAYVPLDPTYPTTRLAHVIEDAGLRVLLSRSDVQAGLPAASARPILLDDLAQLTAGLPATAPTPRHTPDDLAYVIYTSGSTGRPKGVQVRHRGLVNLLWAMRARPGLRATDTMVAVTTLSFDIAALELFLPLVTGAKLVIAEAAEVMDGAALLALLGRHRATVLQATPVTWQLLLDAGWRGVPQLKMLCGGEAMPRRLADALLACGGSLWNMYGPTETTIWSSVEQVRPGAGAVPIGPPIANTRFHVLDRRGRPVPDSAIGELFIAGDGVAAGYHARPALTLERFVPDSAAPDQKMYCTGDLVRRRHDGTLVFLGRADHQLKLRGLRIEPGDIEAVLLDHPAILEAVCVLRSDAVRGDFLAAYAAMREVPGEELVRALQTLLAERLPAYMRPSSLSLLPALPRLPNGKLDRSALPAPVIGEPARADNRSLASFGDETEQRIARIWTDILGVAPPDAGANFFEMGGHSLLAMRMLARLEAAFGERIPLVRLFQAPSVRELARLLHRVPSALAEHQMVRVQPHGEDTPILAINNTGIFYSLSRQLGTGQPFTAVQLFDPQAPQSAIAGSFEDIAAGYVRIIRQAQPRGPYILLGLCVAGCLAFEVAQQLRALGEQVRLVVLLDAWAPGFVRRLPRGRALLADLTYRGQIFIAEMRAAGGTLARLRYLAGRVREKLGLDDGMARYAESPWYQIHLERAAARYDPQPYDGRVLLLHRRDQPSGRFLDPTYGWGGVVGGKLEVMAVEGNHLGMLQEPGARVIAEQIRRVLDETA